MTGNGASGSRNYRNEAFRLLFMKEKALFEALNRGHFDIPISTP
jgi:hypothetical protein